MTDHGMRSGLHVHPDPVEEGQQPPGVDRVFGICSTHGQYELPIASIESGEIPRRCPGCVSEAPVEEGQP